MTVTRRRDGHIGYVEMDNPPVNAIGQSMRAGLLDAVKWAEAEFLDRVILTGAGRAFAAGADAREFDLPGVAPHLPDVLDAIDTSFVPWIAVIDGVALGGGAEVAMACRMRIATPRAQIGLPEVTLGVIPGAGGTQRAPRLVGMARALEMITTGKPLKAAAALKAGLVDLVESDALDEAFMVNSEELLCRVPTWERTMPAADPEVSAATRATLARRSPGQIAPLRALEVVEAGCNLPFHKATALERETFLNLRKGPQSRALRHMFFGERAAKRPPEITAEPQSIEKIAVVGGGTMGAGIAYAILNAGLSVSLIETDAEGVTRARANVEKIIAASLKRGLIDEIRATDLRARLTLTSDFGDAAQATLAIEAAFESMEVKHQVMGALEAHLPATAILATNTSYLDVNEIAAPLRDPSRVIGLHFFAPAHIMKLLEVVRADATSYSALATGFALAKALRKVPVIAGVCDGFIGNRILARYREAADTVFLEGAAPWEVDEAMVAFGYAMGPYEAQDLSGLDIAHANRRRQDATRDPNRRYIMIADRMIELGKLGRKTGAGWYRYPGGGGKVEDPIVADLGIEEAHLAGVTQRDWTPAEIEERLVLAMINEAADILHEGIAANALDIDLVTVLGYGFPRWRGGLMHYADTLGAAQIVARLEVFAQEDPVAWAISPALRHCAKAGTKLADYAP